MLERANDKPLAGWLVTMSGNRYDVKVPCLSPQLNIVIDYGKEEGVKEPNVTWSIWLQPSISFEVLEDILSFLTKTKYVVSSEMFYLDIVNALISMEIWDTTFCGMTEYGMFSVP